MGPWPFPHGDGKPGTFVSGDESEQRYQIRYYRDGETTGKIHAKVWFGPGASGPPAHAHGGAQAAFLDELLGMCCWISGEPVVAASLTTRFRRMLPLGRVLRAEARIVSRSDGRLTLYGEIFDDDGAFSTADGEYALIRGKLAGRIKAAMEKESV